MGKRQSFTRAFKLEAVRLLQSSGRPIADVARKLAAQRNQLYSGTSNSRAKARSPSRARCGAGPSATRECPLAGGEHDFKKSRAVLRERIRVKYQFIAARARPAARRPLSAEKATPTPLIKSHGHAHPFAVCAARYLLIRASCSARYSAIRLRSASASARRRAAASRSWQ
jgi:transposase-like protein